MNKPVVFHNYDEFVSFLTDLDDHGLTIAFSETILANTAKFYKNKPYYDKGIVFIERNNGMNKRDLNDDQINYLTEKYNLEIDRPYNNDFRINFMWCELDFSYSV